MPHGRSCAGAVSVAPAASAWASRTSTSSRVATRWPMLNSPDFGGPSGTSASLASSVLRVEREDQAVIEAEQRDRSGRSVILAGELRPDHAGRLQAEPFPVEGERPIEVTYGQRDHMNARFHVLRRGDTARC